MKGIVNISVKSQTKKRGCEMDAAGVFNDEKVYDDEDIWKKDG